MFGKQLTVIFLISLLLGPVPCQNQDFCDGSTRNSKLSRGHGFEIIKSVKSKLMIRSYPIENEMMCVSDCGLDCECFMTIYATNTCELYKKEAQDYFNKTLTDTFSIYYKKAMLNNLPLYTLNGLQNLWSFDNSLNDSISQCNLTIKLNAALSADRFDNANSALYFNHGYATAPPGVYFDPDTGGFTVMVWFKPVTINSCQRIFDFGNGPDNNNIFVANSGTNPTLYSNIFPGGINSLSVSSVVINVWVHITFTSRDSNTQEASKFYFNGILDSTATGSGTYNKIVRTNCYFGKSNWANELLDGHLDDFKIFSRVLNPDEILREMNIRRPLLKN